MTDKLETEYKKSLDYLFSRLPMFSRIGAAAYKPGLDTTIELDKLFGTPHKKFKSIHIGGTNGKGSTSHLIASVLQAQGYKTALYTSPHLVDFRERMKINGKMIPKEKVVEFTEKWKNTETDLTPSFFELTMMMAFDWFASENVDYAVIEVGMGGRLDSTNVITPMLSVITNISHDHNQFLGNTLGDIAKEKAGIIKRKIPVVIGESASQSDPVFKEKAEECEAELIFADKRSKLDFNDNKGDLKGQSFIFNEEIVTVPLGGEYQKKNIRTAMESIFKLRDIGVSIDNDNIKKGFEKVIELTGLRGRWTVVKGKPLTIADTGHNLAGITYNINQLEKLLSERGKDANLRFIIGFVADKAIDKITDLLPKNAIYYVTNASIPRALPADKLYDILIGKGLNCKIYPDVKTAYDAAVLEAKEEDILFIGGSTFIVADFLAEKEKRERTE